MSKVLILANSSSGLYGFRNELVVELLKKYGIYTDNTLDIECIESACVTNYYPGLDITGMDQEQLNELNVESKEFTYTDLELIKEILENACQNGYYGQWYDYRGHFDSQYSIEIQSTKPVDPYGTTTVYYDFWLGKVPEFVIEDTN